jgi:flagellar biosynthesis protein FlhG
VRPFSEQTHYEILEIAREAPPAEIERAYRIVRATYAEDSLATYSIYDAAELRAIQERIELAHRVLADAEQRAAYDASLGTAERVELALSFADDDEVSASPELKGFEELGEGGPFDGARLRRARLARGIELDRIASVTKINPTYLRFIEDDRFQELPATVYVRGFVTAYVRCLGLEPERIVPSYMERLLAARPEKPLRALAQRTR